jgi:hypothetical protein
MRAAQLIVLESDGWLARNLADLATEGAWLVRAARDCDSAMSLATPPCALLVQVEPADDRPDPLRLIAGLRKARPDVPVVAVSDVKLNDADRVAWTAALLDLGARYVLFPPLTRPVLEDVVSGLMAATVRRTVGDAPDAKPVAPKPRPRPASEDDVIDLADEDVHE